MGNMLGLRQFFIYCSVVSATFFLNSCAEESSSQGDEGEVIEVGAEEDGVIEDQVYNQVPSPHEMMEFMKASGEKFRPELLCTTEIKDRYVDLKGKSMGLGIYIADLAYTAGYGEYQHSMKYFKAITSMADDIGISNVFDKLMLDRIQNNLESPDSLETISNESYYSIIAELENNEQGKVVAMIAAGGFLESLFLAVEQVTDFKENDPMIERIAGQKLVYENLMAYLDKYKDDQNVEWTINDMTALKSVFDDVSDNRMDTKFSEGKGGKRVLGGKGGVYITKQEFEELRNQTVFLRSTITFNPPVP